MIVLMRVVTITIMTKVITCNKNSFKNTKIIITIKITQLEIIMMIAIIVLTIKIIANRIALIIIIATKIVVRIKEYQWRKCKLR